MTDDVYTIPKYMLGAINVLNERDRLACYDALFKYIDTGEVPESGMERSFIILAKDPLDRERKKLETILGRRCKEYQEWRRLVFERDGYTCQKCGKRGGTLNAHHILPYCDFPHMRYVVSNGITLCKECHAGVHHGERESDT